MRADRRTGLREIWLFACVLQLATGLTQPQWRFHLAFEDGTGARDTIWLIYDTMATIPTVPPPGPNVDSILGEAGVDIEPDGFNVWVRNALWDSTKTIAMPYSWYPIFEGPSGVDAVNWTPPITIRWDTSLFHAPYLPGPESIGRATLGGNYFFFNNNHPELHAFDMLLDRKSTRLNSSHGGISRMPSSA